MPRPGYYADPSIPGYIRYWNGSSWVPGTSRPEPKPGEVLTPPPGVVVPQPRPEARPAAQAPPPPRPAAVDESGPVFLDEERGAEEGAGGSTPGGRNARGEKGVTVRAEPAEHADGSGPVPWDRTGSGPASAGQPDFRADGADLGESGPAAASGHTPAAGHTARTGAADSAGTEQAVRPEVPSTRRPDQPYGSAPWVEQVQRLARHDPEPGASPSSGHAVGQTFGDNAMAWRPPPSNPFLQAAQVQGRPAGLARRLVARLIDTVVVAAVCSAVGVPLAMASAEHIRNKIDAARQSGETVRVWLVDGTIGLYLGVFVAVLLLTGFLYEVLPTAKWGRTLGKRLMRVRVLDIEGHDIPTPGRSLRRWLVYQLSGLLAVGVVGVLWCFFDRPWRQCWHDKAARTFVASDGSA